MCEQIPESKRAFVISDETVWTHYGATITQVLDASGIDSVPYIVSPGETSKSINVWAQVVQFLLEHRIERHDAVVALGGGVVGDLAGFAAASVLRG
ncbi:MAG: iron-containing alcohol dehydrogenase, partial [Bacteroidetes bacterium]|nr:iron-containing alcohol dehydrogenase [Bacteroidota bacterium]